MPSRPQSYRGPEKIAQTHPDSLHGSPHSRGYDKRWQKISRLYRIQHPLCEWPGCEELAECVDHIQPFHGRNDPLRLRWDNFQSLCWRHHSQKTARERQQHA